MKKIFLLASLVLSINAIAQIPSYVPSSGLQGWWSFTGNANDESGNGNNGTVNGATLTSDRNGNPNAAYFFNGINDNILINPSSSLDINTSITISAWVKSDNFTGYIFWRGSNLPAHEPYSIGAGGGLLGFRRDVSDGNTTNLVQASSATLNTTEFHHIVGVFDNASNYQSIYVDGVLVQQVVLSGTISYTTSACSNMVGNAINGFPFTGEIDDIGIWNRALTQTEIATLYTGCGNCETPTNITVSSITGTKAIVSWTGNSCAAKYRVRYRVQGTTTWTTKIVTAPVVSKTLTLLLPLTTYEFQVRTDCNTTGTLASAYSPIQTFTTICDCTKPTNIAVSNVSQTAATVSWVGNACALKYRLQYRVQGTTVWTTKTVIAPIATKTITGLTANTIYEYHLRSDCNSDGSLNSGWTSIATITTPLRLEDTKIGSTTFYVSPNPCSNCFVSGTENENDLIISDIVGRIINASFTKTENGFYITLPDGSSGIFLIRNLRTGEVEKFLKQ